MGGIAGPPEVTTRGGAARSPLDGRVRALIAAAAGERGLGVGGWAGGLVVVGAMFVAELGARRCCDALSPRVECC